MAAGIDTVDPLALFAVFLLAVLAFGIFTLIILWRNRDDRRATQAAQQQQLPAELPRNLASGWDRLDEYGRPW